jgi:hypothetical protein
LQLDDSKDDPVLELKDAPDIDPTDFSHPIDLSLDGSN